MILRVVEMVFSIVETCFRVMEMAGLAIVARRRRTLFARPKRAKTLRIQAINGLIVIFI